MEATKATAHILVKRSQTDPVFQRILVRENEGSLEMYLTHGERFRWVALPETWREQAIEALAIAAK